MLHWISSLIKERSYQWVRIEKVGSVDAVFVQEKIIYIPHGSPINMVSDRKKYFSPLPEARNWLKQAPVRKVV